MRIARFGRGDDPEKDALIIIADNEKESKFLDEIESQFYPVPPGTADLSLKENRVFEILLDGDTL